MKVSVIIPARNEEKRIADSLKAVLSQDHADLEVIVVDNASTDRTAEIASDFPVTVVHEPRRGTMWACERGRAIAGGDIIVRLDADCFPEKTWISNGVKHFKKAGVVAVSGPYDYHDAATPFRKISLLTQKYLYVFFSHLLQSRFVRKGAVMIGGNSFMNADTLKKAGGFDTSIVFYGDDSNTAKRLSRHGRIVFDPYLTMKTSARRFKNEGIIATEIKYIYHFFKHAFKKT